MYNVKKEKKKSGRSDKLKPKKDITKKPANKAKWRDSPMSNLLFYLSPSSITKQILGCSVKVILYEYVYFNLIDFIFCTIKQFKARKV